MTDFAAAREAMVDCQVRPSDVTRYAIIDAMLTVPRELFVPTALREVAYAETDINLANGRTLLAPRTFAKMLEAADIGKNELVLDLAPATGYSTAVLARLAAAVVAVESQETYLEDLRSSVAEHEIDNAMTVEGEPHLGHAELGPYDVIFINGGVETVPAAVRTQLKDGGRLVAIFTTGSLGQCRVLVRAGDSITDRYEFDATAPVLPGFQNEAAFAF